MQDEGGEFSYRVLLLGHSRRRCNSAGPITIPITIPSAISSTIDGNRILGKSPSASGAASAAAATIATPPNETFVS